MVATFEIQRLAWDTNFFGIDSCKVILNNDINKDDFKEILDRTKKYQFITIQNNNNSDSNNRLIGECSEAFLVDINTQFAKNIDKKQVFMHEEKIAISNNLERDENVLNIAKDAFICSRFVTDYNLINGDEVYYNWVQNSFNKDDKFFATYSEHGIVLGFILFSMRSDITTLELVAVSRRSQGKHIGTQLEQAVEKYSAENGIMKINVGTQLNNIPAQNFYIKCGFRHQNYNSIYHLWNNHVREQDHI